jgi:hypothetical protein
MACLSATGSWPTEGPRQPKSPSLEQGEGSTGRTLQKTFRMASWCQQDFGQDQTVVLLVTFKE